MSDYPEFIPDAGACLVSINVINSTGRVKWMLREESKRDVDNGWRIFSDVDTAEFLADVDNLKVVDYNAVCSWNRHWSSSGTSRSAQTYRS